MESRYSADDASRTILELAPRATEAVALRTYTARLIGREPSLVLHGGGNTSVKSTATTVLGETVDVIHIKGSGWDLATIEPEGHPAVRLAPLGRLRALEAMSDEAMVNELRTNLLDSSAPNPSVETLLHAFLPARFVDHTHADAILALCDQPEGERIFTSLFGRGLVWVPYIMPGFALARRCAAAFERVTARGEAAVMVLEKHGLFTWGETARESYERTIDAVSRAERFIAEKRRHSTGRSASAQPAAPAASSEPATSSAPHPPAALDVVLPRLRGVLAKLAGDALERGPIVRTRTSREILAFLERPDAAELVDAGCATPDHVLRTKPSALLLPRPTDDGPRLSADLEAAVGTYARAYDEYFDRMCRANGVTKTKLDPWPRLVLVPGLGLCAIGETAREADVALDVYEHTIGVMADAAAVGRYAPCSRADLFDVEYWSLEQAKLKPPARRGLARCVAVVTGAASGIGLATAAKFLAEGAHVALVDRDAESLSRALSDLSAGKDRALAGATKERAILAVADVRDDEQVRAAFARVVSSWGGVDVVVSNAGTAPEGRLETADGAAALRESLDLNCLAHARVVRHAVGVMSAQGRGGSLAFNASKSAFNPGPGFGPYAVAKSALVALMKQFAVDLGPHAIRSNAVNADRIRTQLFAGGVLASRAKARGLSVDEYFRANLLAREVTADDVAGAFVYLATARSTTGCVITVDGGNAAAFPR